MTGCSRGRSRTGAVLTVASVVLALLVGLFVFMASVASYKSSQVQRHWAQTLGTRDEILARFPQTEANAAALTLERLSARLGIDTATRFYADRAHPTPERRSEFMGTIRAEMTYRNS